MTTQSQMLKEILNDLGIIKGATESDESLKCRAVYSAIGRLAYASLWDEIDESDQNASDASNDDSSIIHFKRRIKKSFETFARIFPEIIPYYSYDVNNLSDFVFNLFEATGQFYHSPYQVSPPIRTAAYENGISFLRGFSPFENAWASGLGAFVESENAGGLTPCEMFGLPRKTPVEQWKNAVSVGNFSAVDVNDYFEFLNLNISKGTQYWVNKSNLKNGYSLMRTKDYKIRSYYLYKYENNKFWSSGLPDFMTMNSEYLSLANGCLMSRNSLPKCFYHYNGEIVILELGYLYPPRVQNLVMLYSWPISYSNIQGRFKRVMTSRVFKAIKEVLENLNYEFAEVQ